MVKRKFVCVGVCYRKMLCVFLSSPAKEKEERKKERERERERRRKREC